MKKVHITKINNVIKEPFTLCFLHHIFDFIKQEKPHDEILIQHMAFLVL